MFFMLGGHTILIASGFPPSASLLERQSQRMNDPINQHLVPKVYLRPFCIPSKTNEQIHVYDFLDGQRFRASIGKIAVQHHFYTLDLASERPSFAIENALGKIESDVQPLIQELTQTQALFAEPEKRAKFSIFLATLLMRGRHGLEVAHKFREEVRIDVANRSSRPRQSGIAADELLSLDENGMRELFAKFVLKLAVPISKHFQSMHWRLLRAEEDHFVTSENPLVIYNPSDERWGLGSKGSHIHLPISPALLLHFGNEPSITQSGTVQLQKAGVAGINGLTVLATERYLFSHQPFDALPYLLLDRPAGSKRTFGPHR